MAGRISAGLLLYRRRGDELEVLLVHPGGPFWARRDDGAWSLPKGEHEPGDDPLAAAQREFEEEIGSPPPAAEWIGLGSLLQKGGKTVRAWAGEGDLDVSEIRSSTFTIEVPPRSGRLRTYPEVDRAGWFTVPEARVKMLASQLPFLERLGERLSS